MLTNSLKHLDDRNKVRYLIRVLFCAAATARVFAFRTPTSSFVPPPPLVYSLFGIPMLIVAFHSSLVVCIDPPEMAVSQQGERKLTQRADPGGRDAKLVGDLDEQHRSACLCAALSCSA